MIIYKLRDPDRAPALADHFQTLFQHDAASWQEREQSTLHLFTTLRLSAAITVSLDYSAGRFRDLQCADDDRPGEDQGDRDFAFDGLSAADICAIFLWQGALIAAGGSIIGVLPAR